jgi:hypothetical protein
MPMPCRHAPEGQHTDVSRRQPRAVPRPVSLKGRMTASGYEPENYEWLDVLTTVKNGCRVARDPLTIQPEVLTAAGHGPRRTRSIVAALGDEPVDESIIRHKDLRKHCLSCAESKAEVRRCAIIDCHITRSVAVTLSKAPETLRSSAKTPTKNPDRKAYDA